MTRTIGREILERGSACAVAALGFALARQLLGARAGVLTERARITRLGGAVCVN